jgi:hypothetical protein
VGRERWEAGLDAWPGPEVFGHCRVTRGGSTAPTPSDPTTLGPPCPHLNQCLPVPSMHQTDVFQALGSDAETKTAEQMEIHAVEKKEA